MPQAYANRLLVAVALCPLGAAQLQGQTAGVGELNLSGAREPTPFQDCLAGIKREATRRGISDAIANQNLGDVSPDPDVLAAVQGQAEFERPIWEYVDKAIREDRVRTGQAKLAEWAAVLDGIEARFGVD